MANSKLTNLLIDMEVLQDEKLISAFNNVDRRDFLPESQKKYYLENRPIPIGYEQTNSQPFTVAFMLELLLPDPSDNVLDVGSGSGWTSALIASMLSGGSVTAVELIPELVEQSKKNLSSYKFKNIQVLAASESIGLEQNAPYQQIIVSAAAKKLPPELIAQLDEQGRLVIPINESIFVYEKTPDGLKSHEFPGFRFVPLI